MQALTILDVGQLGVRQHPDPTPGAGEVLVRVHAAGLNAADIAQRAGTYPAPAGAPADIPGLEFAGEVIAVGPSALRFAVGDRVMSIVSGGGQAELIAVHERQLMPVPDALSWQQAGGFPEVFLTAHDALVAQAGLRPGERVLINGAGGGVGMAAVQIASVLGAEVVASVRNPAIRGEVVALGASAAVVPVAIDPAEVAKLGPYDVVLELVSGDNVGPALSALNQRGRIVIIGASPESMTVELDLNLLRAKRALLTGSTLRSRPLEEKAAVVRDVEREILPHVASGRITVPLAASFALADGQEAYDSFHGRGKFGKIVLLP